MIKKLLALSLLLSSTAYAGDELYMQTDVGYVVLTKQACEYKFDHPTNFKYRAYATDVNAKEPHEGCWYLDSVEAAGGTMGSINIYFPEINATAYYNPNIFTDKKESY